MLASEVICQYNLSVILPGSMAVGPVFNYASGDVRTIVDYVLADVEVASLISSCHTLPMDNQNTSDHFPLVLEMMYTPL